MSTVTSKIIAPADQAHLLRRTPVTSTSMATGPAPDAHSFARLLTVREVATILRIHPNRVYELASRRAIPAVRIGRLLRFHLVALQEWIESGGTQGEERPYAAVCVVGRG